MRSCRTAFIHRKVSTVAGFPAKWLPRHYICFDCCHHIAPHLYFNCVSLILSSWARTGEGFSFGPTASIVNTGEETNLEQNHGTECTSSTSAFKTFQTLKSIKKGFVMPLQDCGPHQDWDPSCKVWKEQIDEKFAPFDDFARSTLGAYGVILTNTMWRKPLPNMER